MSVYQCFSSLIPIQMIVSRGFSSPFKFPLVERVFSSNKSIPLSAWANRRLLGLSTLQFDSFTRLNRDCQLLDFDFVMVVATPRAITFILSPPAMELCFVAIFTAMIPSGFSHVHNPSDGSISIIRFSILVFFLEDFLHRLSSVEQTIGIPMYRIQYQTPRPASRTRVMLYGVSPCAPPSRL